MASQETRNALHVSGRLFYEHPLRPTVFDGNRLLNPTSKRCEPHEARLTVPGIGNLSATVSLLRAR